MSEYTFCPYGGQDGILVTEEELSIFASTHGKECIDQIMPIPSDLRSGEQISPEDCQTNHDEGEDCEDNIVYWEMTTGSHGWCCSTCGYVFQWFYRQRRSSYAFQ